MEVGSFLFDILVVLVAAKIAGELSQRVGIPPVVGEIVAGIAIGPSLVGLVAPSEVLSVLAELGVILLLVEVGMQMDLAGLRAVGATAMSVATVGVLLPFVGGSGAALALGMPPTLAIFLGASLTATSVGITARVFADMRKLNSSEARTVLGAAVADDVMGLILLTVVSGVAAGAGSAALDIARVVAVALGFLIVASIVGFLGAPPLLEMVSHRSRHDGTFVAIALAFVLLLSATAGLVGLAPVVGAFVAGLALARHEGAEQVQRELRPVGHLLIPVFFLQIGIETDVLQFIEPDAVVLAVALFSVAVFGKLAAGLAIRGNGLDRLTVGLGMLPRGEVGLIFAGIGLRSGVFGDSEYGALVLVVLVTTVMTPPLLRWRMHRLATSERKTIQSPRLSGNGLHISDGLMELAFEPPDARGLDVALEAARWAADGMQPGPRLIEWLSSLERHVFRWSEGSRRSFMELMGRGSERSWRFLEVAGVLERALPEIAEALSKRRSDPFDLDPFGSTRWNVGTQLNVLVSSDREAQRNLDLIERRGLLFLAAVIIDIGDSRKTKTRLARRTAQRLGLGAAAEQHLVLIVTESGLFPAAARRGEVREERRILELAVHLARPETARSLYLIGLVIGGRLEPWERGRMDALHEVVQEVLAHPDVVDRGARNLIERRRTQAMSLIGDAAAERARIEDAPDAYSLAHGPEDLALHATLLADLRGPRPRFSVLPFEDGTWRIDVAARPSKGALVAAASVLSAGGMDVRRAEIGVWPDDAIVISMTVAGRRPPPTEDLEVAFADARRNPRPTDPILDVQVDFDDEASPWRTLCEVRTRDRQGLLFALATAIERSDVLVRAARVETEGSKARDRFEFSDRSGGRLDQATKDRLVVAIHEGSRAVYKRRSIPEVFDRITKRLFGRFSGRSGRRGADGNMEFRRL